MEFTSSQLYFGGIGAVVLTGFALTSASHQKRLSRSGFLMIHIVVAGLAYVGWELSDVLSERSDQLGSFVGVMQIGAVPLLYFLLVRWAVFRLQNIGWSKWWAAFYVVPGVDLVLWLVLLVWPGRWDPSLTA